MAFTKGLMDGPRSVILPLLSYLLHADKDFFLKPFSKPVSGAQGATVQPTLQSMPRVPACQQEEQ